jgi:hypothetical protein
MQAGKGPARHAEKNFRRNEIPFPVVHFWHNDRLRRAP